MKKIFFLVVVALFVACNDSDSRSDNGSAPVITNLELLKVWPSGASSVETNYDIGDDMNCRLYVNDPDRDLSYFTLKQFLPSNSTIPYYDVWTIQAPTQYSDDAILSYGSNIENVGPSGSWRVEVQAFDAKGNSSNIFEVFITTN